MPGKKGENDKTTAWFIAILIGQPLLGGWLNAHPDVAPWLDRNTGPGCGYNQAGIDTC